MSKNKNYRKMYPAEEQTNPVAEAVDGVVDTVVEQTREEIVCPEKCEYVTGTVVDCSRLNVREHPNADSAVKQVIARGAEVRVCTAHNYEDWCEVCTTSGVEGYCMKQYISLQK